MTENKRDLQGFGLSLLNRFAGSKAVDALGLRKPAEKALYTASRASFGAANLAGQQLKAVRGLLQPDRLARVDRGDLFDLTPTEEQQLLQDATRRFAEDVLRPAATDAEAHREISEEVWEQAHALGLAAMAVPERLGGAAQERSAITAGLVAEALAWGDMGQACALLAPVGVVHALSRWGTAEQQMTYLPAFVQDTPPDAAIALLESHPLADPLQPRCRARLEDGHWVIDGEKRLVPLGRFAELLIISADCEGLGPRLLLVERGREGVSRAADESMGLIGGSLGHITLKGVRVAESAVLGDAAALQDAVHLARLMWCSLAVGCAQAVLDLVTPYVNERKAFGEPIAYRQGVAFIVSNMAIAVDGMRLMTWRALARADQGLPFAREAVLAHRFCADNAMQIGSDGVQLLGGHGFVKEYPVERWYRDLRAVGVQEGGVLA